MKRLLLAGGGHSHVEVLRRFAVERDDAIAITVVNPQTHSAYSGMLPGHVAGHYAASEIFVDLRTLASRANGSLVTGSIASIDPVASVATCDDGTTIAFDVCSIDVGSVPSMDVAGAREHAIAIKPVARFLSQWSMLVGHGGHAAHVDHVEDAAHAEGAGHAEQGEKPGDAQAVRDIAIVGAGAGGVEILLAMQQAMRSGSRSGLGSGSGSLAQAVATTPRFHLITDTACLLPSHPANVREIFERVVAARGVDVVTNARVVGVDGTHVHCADGRSIAADHVFWTTSAVAPSWIARSGLAVDERGFLRVDRSLRSLSHPHVLGAGDAIAIDGLPLPKAGVFAVRQGPVLARNLRAALRGEALATFDTKPHALNLISTGDRCAVMTWRGLALEGEWVWRWKDWIDRRWMRRYR